MMGYSPPSPPVGAPTGMQGALAAWVAQQVASMQADGTLHSPMADGGLEVPQEAFRESGT